MMAMRLEMVRFQRQAEVDKKQERAQNQEEHAKREMELNETLERKRLAEEEEKARTRADAAKRHLKRDLHPLTAKDRPSTYMACFERLAREHAVPKESWAGCFLTCLTGDHLAMWASYVEAHDTTDYDAIKSYFLNRVGLNWETRSKYISCPKKPFNLNWDQYFYQQIDDLKLLTEGTASVEEACHVLVKAQFCNFIQGASRTELARKKDLPSQEFLQAFINAYQSNRVLYEPLDHKGSGHSFNRKPFQEWEPGHEKPECKVEVPADKYHNPQVSKNQFQVGITCHHCGEEGHIRPNCPKMPERPKKIMMVATENDCDKFEPVSGMVNGSPAQITLDSGAEFCIVSEELSKGAEVVPRTVLLNWFTPDHVIKAPVCRVNVEVMGRQVNCEAAIVPNIEDEFILGLNVGKRMLAELIHAAAFQPHKVGITRLQEKKRQQMEQQCAILDEASGAVPHLNESKDRVEAVEVALDMPAPAIHKNENSTLPEDVSEDDPPHPTAEISPISTPPGEDADIPLPSLDSQQREELIKCTMLDPSLASLREHADQHRLGHSWQDGILMHEAELANIGTVYRIVVPSQFRKLILELSHERAGHLSVVKMRALLAPMYTWPGVHRDVCNHALACRQCQVFKRATPAKAPYQAMPAISEPFEKLAVDLVGPFPRSKLGMKYLLTGICLASRYPEAIPLRDISAATVAEGLVEMFSRTGIPRVILSDQGAQFMGSVVQSLCGRLGVTHIKTSTYHPQSNGCLERFHGTLVPMLRKVSKNNLSWPEQIKYVLFALRGMPSRTTGFSPYEVVFGRKFPSPLGLLFDDWVDKRSQPVKLTDWLDRFDKRVELVRDSLRDRLSAVQASNQLLEQQKRLRSFQTGDKVLLRTCGLPNKLAQTWEGPYVVKRKLGLVNYELDMGARRRASVVHINNLKAWHLDSYSVCKVVLAQDLDHEDEPPTIMLKERRLSEEQLDQLHQLQDKFKHCLSKVPGTADAPPISIDTGQHAPLSKPPYRIPDRWKAELRSHTTELLDLQIIRPSSSPWCSSSVTVGKADGTLRLCQDYRPLNGVTVPDPYQMKRVDDTLDLLGTSPNWT